MNRLQFIASLATLPYAVKAFGEETSDEKKIIKFLEKSKSINMWMEGMKYNTYEAHILNRDGLIVYKVQYSKSVKEEEAAMNYFLLINIQESGSKKRYLAFDFNLDENVDVYIEPPYLGDTMIMDSIDDAMRIRNGIQIKNKNLKSIDDRINETFRGELKEIVKLLGIK